MYVCIYMYVYECMYGLMNVCMYCMYTLMSGASVGYWFMYACMYYVNKYVCMCTLKKSSISGNCPFFSIKLPISLFFSFCAKCKWVWVRSTSRSFSNSTRTSPSYVCMFVCIKLKQLQVQEIFQDILYSYIQTYIHAYIHIHRYVLTTPFFTRLVAQRINRASTTIPFTECFLCMYVWLYV